MRCYLIDFDLHVRGLHYNCEQVLSESDCVDETQATGWGSTVASDIPQASEGK